MIMYKKRKETGERRAYLDGEGKRRKGRREGRKEGATAVPRQRRWQLEGGEEEGKRRRGEEGNTGRVLSILPLNTALQCWPHKEHTKCAH